MFRGAVGSFSPHVIRRKQPRVSLMMGPPNEPPNWLLWRAVCGCGLKLKKFRALRSVFRKYSNSVPCGELVPDLVTILITAPALRPYSGVKSVITASSAMASTGRIVAGVPNTPASLIAGSFR